MNYKPRPNGWIPIEFFVGEEDLEEGEEFVDLTDQCIPGLKDHYQVSNHGRVFNKHYNLMRKLSVGTDGYFQVNLSTENGDKLLRVNRLVMMGFEPIDNADEMVVNHLDGVPQNNHLDNLEWTTRSGNAKHAYKIGLMKGGEDGPNTIISAATADKIGDLLQTNMTFQQIVDEVQGGATISIVQSIFQRKCWVELNKDKVFRQTRKQKRFSEEDIHSICQYFQDHPIEYKRHNSHLYDYFKQMLIDLNYLGREDELGFDNLSKTLNSCDDIFKRVSYTDISCDYIF